MKLFHMKTIRIEKKIIKMKKLNSKKNSIWNVTVWSNRLLHEQHRHCFCGVRAISEPDNFPMDLVNEAPATQFAR